MSWNQNTGSYDANGNYYQNPAQGNQGNNAGYQNNQNTVHQGWNSVNQSAQANQTATQAGYGYASQQGGYPQSQAANQYGQGQGQYGQGGTGQHTQGNTSYNVQYTAGGTRYTPTTTTGPGPGTTFTQKPSRYAAVGAIYPPMTHARRGHSATRSSEATTDPRANPAAHVDKTNAYGHEMHMAEIQMTKSQKRGRRGAVDQGRRTVDIEDDLLVAALARFGIGEQEVVQRGKGGAVEKLNDLEDMFGKLEM